VTGGSVPRWRITLRRPDAGLKTTEAQAEEDHVVDLEPLRGKAHGG